MAASQQYCDLVKFDITCNLAQRNVAISEICNSRSSPHLLHLSTAFSLKMTKAVVLGAAGMS
jgi:hypothetical protein